MSETPSSWSPLLAQADTLPDGPARLVLLEEAVRLADLHGDTAAGFHLRNERLFLAAYRVGRPDKVLVAFTWCLAQCDREPTLFDGVRLCREHYYNLLRIVRDAPDIPRPQAEALLADLMHRLREPYAMTWMLHEQAALLLAVFGDFERAADYWIQRDRLLPGTVGRWQFSAQGSEVVYHLLRDDESAALRAAEPLFDWVRRGRQNSSFAWIAAHLLSPLWRAGRGEEAHHWQRVGYPELRDLVIRLGEIGRHIEFLAAVGELDHAVRLFERHVGWLFISTETIDLFHFHLAGWLLLRKLRERGETARLRLPTDLSCHRADGVYDVDELAEYFGGVAKGIAGRYDARAGNDCFSRTLLAPVLRMG